MNVSQNAKLYIRYELNYTSRRKVKKEECQNDNCGYFLMAELLLLN